MTAAKSWYALVIKMVCGRAHGDGNLYGREIVSPTLGTDNSRNDFTK